MVAHHELADRLRDIDTAPLETLVVLDGSVADLPGLVILGRADLSGDERLLHVLERPIEPWDPQSIIFTSGTTGPSKGVLSSYAHMWAMSGRDAFPMLTGDDCYMCNLPLFRVGGTIAPAATLQRGGTLAVADPARRAEPTHL
jgi:crotonobetaine/carnitine-CoA ligase